MSKHQISENAENEIMLKIIAQDFDFTDVLKLPLMAHLSTLHEEGPHSPAWFLWEDPYVWLVGTEQDAALLMV